MTEPDEATAAEARGSRPLAWAVHLFTASGLVLALLALDAVHRQRWTEAMLWLLAALAIDGVDGTLARAARVKSTLPRIDGDALDLIIDYLNYVLIPTLLMWRAGLFEPGWELPLSAIILLSSAYNFTRRDMKTGDGYFRGFPALWNLVALYLFFLSPTPGTVSAVVVLLAIATFAPVHFVHPFRVTDYGRWLLALSAVWATATAGLVIVERAPVFVAISLTTAALLVAAGLWRSLRGSRG